MFEKIKELIVESLGIEEDQVTMEASFKEDLKVDSLDLFEMVMSLEDEFDVEIPTEELEKMETVGDVVEYIKEHKEAEGQRMKTVITELLGIEYPVIQGGMAWVGTAELAAAVSEAGGLGIIGAGGAPASWVEEQIHKVKEKTDKPFGVNLMLLNPEADAIAELLVKEEVKVVTTGAGNPEKYMEEWKKAGVRVIPVVASTALAKRMEKAGADAVIAEGTESGGHIGETTTMALVPQVVDAVNIPVIAAGGIADGRGMAAAFMLGAKAIQMGTIFVASKESIVSEAYKNKVIKAKDIDTKVTGRTTGHPVRCLRNQQTREYLKLEQAGASFEELEKLTLGGLRKAVVDGDVIHGSVMAGQIAGLVKDSRSCKEIIEGICREMKNVVLSQAENIGR